MGVVVLVGYLQSVGYNVLSYIRGLSSSISSLIISNKLKVGFIIIFERVLKTGFLIEKSVVVNNSVNSEV